jgi:hypothetical protein
MGLIDFVDYVQTLTPSETYPLAFPEDSEDEAVLVKFEPSFNNKGFHVLNANLQTIVRSKHPQTAEQTADLILKHFDGKTNFYIGPFHVVLASSKNPFPMYLSVDDLGRYKYNVNISLMISKNRGE